MQPRRVHYSDQVSYQCTVDESSSARILFAYPSASYIPPAWKLGLNCPCLKLDMATEGERHHIRHVPKAPSFSADVYDFRESAVNQFQGKVASSFKTCYHGKPFGMLDCKGDLRMLRVFESNMRKVLRSALCEVEEKSGVQTVELRLTVDLVTSCTGPM